MAPDAPPLDLPQPYLNAAGSLGFVPKEASLPNGLTLGAFITNPISLQARRPSLGQRILAFPGGVLLHTGLPNPGLRRCIQDYGMAWAHAGIPIVLDLLVNEPAGLRKVMPNIEALDNILAVELNIPADASPGLAADLCSAAAGKLPVIAQLSLLRAEELADRCLASGASAVSLGPPRGSLPGEEGSLVNGRLYGPAIYPQALAVTQSLGRAGVPVIAGGGMQGEAEARAALAAGAMAVQLDVGLWR